MRKSKKVPEVLLSGHHANVDKWRREQSIIRTAKCRPDLLPKADLTNKEWNEVRRLRKQMCIRDRYVFPWPMEWIH